MSWREFSKEEFCIHCGTKAPSGALFCPHCGEPLDPSYVYDESISPEEVVAEGDENPRDGEITLTPGLQLVRELMAAKVLYEGTIRGVVTKESRVIGNKMFVGPNSNINVTIPFFQNNYQVFAEVYFVMRLEEGFEGVPEEILVYSSKFGFFERGDKVILEGKILERDFNQRSRPVPIIFAEHFYNESLQVGDKESEGKKQVLYKGKIRGVVRKEPRVNVSVLYADYGETYFIMKLEMPIGIVEIPNEILVHSVPARLVRKGDKVILKGKIVKKDLKRWNKPMYVIEADHYYNESLQIGDREIIC